MKHIILLFLSLFVTSLPIISFSQMDYSTHPTITRQIPSANTQSQPGYLILAPIIINDSGGTKIVSDFTVNTAGKIVGKSFIHASFQALPEPEIKIVSMQEDNYSLTRSNVQGYKVSQQNQCQVDIKPGEVKTCLIALNGDATATAPFPPQTGGGAQQTQPPQCPAGWHFEQTTQHCVQNIPPQTDTPFHFTAAGDFRDNTNTDENMAANNPEVVLILGDFSYQGNAKQWWSKNMDALNNLNVIGALGNHDEPNDDFLNLWPLNEGKWEFIKKVSNVAFVAFDTENNDPSSVDQLLAQAQADPTVDHIIPFGHKTVFTPTPGNSLKPDADRGYFDVFKKYDKIRMILGGHNHFYARMNAVSGTDFIYVTVGNGGANPHKDSGESGSPPKQYVRSNGALHCDVNNETISCKMISNEGKVWDEFTITPGNPPASEQDPAQAPEIIIQQIPSMIITPGNPPASEQDPAQAPEIIIQQIPSMIIQQIPSIDKQSQPSYHLRDNYYE